MNDPNILIEAARRFSEQREEVLGLVEHAVIDIAYLRQQLRSAQSAFTTRVRMLDCVNRAGDASERVAEALDAIALALFCDLDPPGQAESGPWTVEDILRGEG